VHLYFVRHAQSEWQPDDGVDRDMPLTALGQEQAQALAAWLAKGGAIDVEDAVTVGALWVSPRVRARQTAEPVATALDLPSEEYGFLRAAAYAHTSRHLPTRESPSAPLVAAPPSEDHQAFVRQVDEAVRAMIERAGEVGSVLAVTHGGFIKSVFRHVLGAETFTLKNGHTGIAGLEWRGERWRVTDTDLRDHLPVELRTI
jgi:broad specificity phosphatase PhoE